MDWGCATQNPDRPHPLPTRILDPRSLTSPFGSPSYMPPELAKGAGKEISPRTDIYLLGAMLYELVEGRPPKGGSNIYAVLNKATTGAIDPFSKCAGRHRCAYRSDYVLGCRLPAALNFEFRSVFIENIACVLKRTAWNAGRRLQ